MCPVDNNSALTQIMALHQTAKNKSLHVLDYHQDQWIFTTNKILTLKPLGIFFKM